MKKKITDDRFVRAGWKKQETENSTMYSSPVLVEGKVTIIMTSWRNTDFTLSALWSIFQYYPNIQVIITDGSDAIEFQKLIERLSLHYPDKWMKNLHAMLLPHAPTEDCRNSAAAWVTSPYILFCDNDIKILGPGAIDVLLEPLELFSNCVQSGAYGFICLNREKRIGCVGKEFMAHTQLSASPAYFSLHLTAAYRDVGGMPKQFYYDVPKALWQDSNGETIWQPGWSGDFTITDLYHRFGLVCVSPRRRVPVLHWGQTNRYINQKRPVEDWWYGNVRHINTEPFTRTIVAAAMKEEEIDGNFESLFKVQPRFSAEDDI